MKKKLMMVAVLLGALSLGACVDDNESASVTAIRNAKALQLEALADYYSAQAEAELIAANADAEYKAAQAKYQEALAAVQNANAESIAFETQKAKEDYERDLEAINLEAQNRLLTAKIDAAEKEQDFLNLANDLLKGLYQTYAAELSTLDSYKEQLNQQNLLISRVEASLIPEEEYVAAQTAIQEANIATYEAQIAAYEAYEGIDKSELQAEVNRLTTERSNALIAQGAAWKAMTNARDAYNDEVETFNYNNEPILKTVQAVDTLINELNLRSVVNTSGELVLNKEYNITVVKYSLVGEAVVVNARQTLNSTIDSYETTLGAPAAGTTGASGLYLDLKNLQDQLAAATTAENQALIDQYTYQIAQKNDEINSTKKLLEEANEDLRMFEAAIKTFEGDDWKAYEAALEALKTNEVVVAYVEAYAAYDAAEETFNDINAEYGVAVTMRDNYGIDAQAQIRTLESNIASCKQTIANLSTNVNDYEIQLQSAKDEVIRLTTQIEMQEAVVALAKENLDNAIAAQGGDVEA